jgi:hypothetical protein
VNGGFLRVVVRQLIEQDHIQQRLMHLDAAVITDKSELAKTVHKEADTRPGGADGTNFALRFLLDSPMRPKLKQTTCDGVQM